MSNESQATAEAETYEPRAAGDAGDAGSAGIGELSNSQVYLIDVETIRDTVSVAREMPLSRDARPRIALTTATLIGQLELLIGEDLNFDLDPAVRDTYKAAYRLLRIDRRPTNDDPTFAVWEYMRDVAAVTSQLVETYAEQQGEAESDEQ
ncbi:hypothetical protein [Streptomyces sp. NBC_01506]|uniref:hypothetical protein n=1 Tax=Streptomyces sp. NBC_01506 TaxID=2903887 RepID=UPI00386A81B4